MIRWGVFLCDGIEDASFKACLYEVSQPGLPGLAALYRACSAYALFFLKIIVVFICKGGQARLTRSRLEKPASWKQASPPSRIKWKQGMNWTSLVKQASRLANRAAWLKPSSKISVFHESSHEIRSIFILYCFPPIGAFRKQSLFYKYYRKNLTNYNSQLSTNYN